ncbi:hypothetical protein J8273_5691 [Carpediemonas membranifera]|uniref:Uncharacterized protein n=1 Tax=Carpediemonas membranifera TaxID=201153 RepID=A0A8J6B4L3_9EUKA|nr:hypothetical protein J8273_5691 [Carpediemonas membranifera]|eukprot:KAG9392879.1 hypothetical protein J8273_5691 [Carpediemonas membranifera]
MQFTFNSETWVDANGVPLSGETDAPPPPPGGGSADGGRRPAGRRRGLAGVCRYTAAVSSFETIDAGMPEEGMFMPDIPAHRGGEQHASHVLRPQ